MEIEQILHINVNNKKTLILMGTTKGFRVYNFFTMNLLKHKIFSGGIGPIDCLETSNILALSGGGLFPYFPSNKLIIWDDEEQKIKAEIVFKTEINALKFKYEYLLVICDYKIYIYNVFENLTLRTEIITSFNPRGRVETNCIDTPSLIAFLVNPEVNELSNDEGIACVYNINKDKKKIINAHNSLIKCMRLNYKGNIIATASVRGTIVRIFNTETGLMIKEFRRGLESTVIHSLDFDYFDNWLTCICQTGTIHIWKLASNKEDNKKQSTVSSFFKKFFISNLERNFACVKTNATKSPVILFDKDVKIRVISLDGVFQEYELECEKEKIIKVKEPIQLINQNLSMM